MNGIEPGGSLGSPARKILQIALAAAGLLGPLPVLAQEAPSSSGFYVGGHVGYMFGTANATQSDPNGVASAGGLSGYGAFMGGGNDHRNRWQILGILGQAYDVRRISKTLTSNIYQLAPRE